ncbi:MAG: indolepyruvate ferredoxin oxidoreductase subunit alpha [Vampirovibrionia bacterium]
MGRIVIDPETCKGCYLCIDVCPKDMIIEGEMINHNGYHPAVFRTDKDDCIGCALCATRCPDIAIKEVYK